MQNNIHSVQRNCSQTFWFQDSLRAPKSFCLCILHLLIFIALEVKPKTLKINPLQIHINHVSTKHNFSKTTTKISEKSGWYYFTNIFNVWFNKSVVFYLLLHLIYCYLWFCLKYMKKIQPHTNTQFKRENFNSLSDNCG